MRFSATAVFLAAGLVPALPVSARAATPTVVVVQDGTARLPVLVGSVKEPAEELGRYLKAISGAEVKVEPAREGATGVYVGLVSDFPWLKVDGTDQLGDEGFVIRSDGKSLLLLGKAPGGVRNAVTGFLQALGCRWFFPGKTWEVIPKRSTVSGSWDERQTPSFPFQRKIWYGFGGSSVCLKDFAEWERHNHMGGPIPINIGHTWHGLDPKADFERHPEWFALVNGKRKDSKPCYSNPEVIERAKAYALAQAERGGAMVSMTPPDGLGYCECERCIAAARGGKITQEKGTTFATRPDGVLVNITSENLFQFINKVAEAVAAKHPKTLIGCYAYSAYSHPPSFPVHPNVFVQTTTAFRRTPLTLPQQLETFQKIGVRSGIRGYASVYQWDWDYPVVGKGDLALPQLVKDLRFYQKSGVQSVNSEASCNWGPRGLGYYLSARLMWNVNEDPKALIADFYDKAFGPAALPMERYYVRWLGPYAAIRTRPTAQAPGATTPAGEGVKDELGAGQGTPEQYSRETLSAAFRDLDEAARLVKDRPEYQARVDYLRLYAHFLFLRARLDDAAKAKDRDRVREAVREETVFGSRLMDTGVIHARPLIGKEFYRRFQPYKQFLEGTPEWPQSDSKAVGAAAGKGFRVARTDTPGRDELETLWAADKKELGLP